MQCTWISEWFVFRAFNELLGGGRRDNPPTATCTVEQAAVALEFNFISSSNNRPPPLTHFYSNRAVTRLSPKANHLNRSRYTLMSGYMYQYFIQNPQQTIPSVKNYSDFPITTRSLHTSASQRLWPKKYTKIPNSESLFHRHLNKHYWKR